MSISSLSNDVTRIERDIADTHKKFADESKRELDKQRQIDTVNKSMIGATSASSMQSKLNQLRSYQNDLVNIQKKKADLSRKQSGLSQNLSRKRQDLAKEEQRERDRVNKEQKEFQRKLRQEIDQTQQAFIQPRSLWTDKYKGFEQPTIIEKEYDFFISHASEDKDYAEPLTGKLIEAGKAVWLDALVLKIGDSLRSKIDEGLKRSRFAVVLLSEFYFKKFWTNKELAGLVAREVNGHKIILPIWHKVTRDEVLNYSPTLADKFAFNTSVNTMDEIVNALVKELED